jgi:hypothetical protein
MTRRAIYVGPWVWELLSERDTVVDVWHLLALANHGQGLTLVHFSVQHKHILCETWGA